MARFSVFIPVWNGAEWLPGAIESVLAQTHADWELVLGDNASTDDLAAVAARYPDRRIRYHRWATHVPIYENFNRTARLCREDWVQALGADDRLEPDCLAALAACIASARGRSARLAAAIGGCERVDAQGRPAQAAYSHQRVIAVPAGFHDASSWLFYAAQPGIAPWNVGAVALARDLLDEIGGFYRPDVGLGSDVEVVMRAAAYGEIAYVDRSLLRCTVRGDSDRTAQAVRNRRASRVPPPMAAAFASALQAHRSRRDVDPAEARRIGRAVARAYLQRAMLHRRDGGPAGWRAALADVGRALGHDPLALASAEHAGYAAAALLVPAPLLRRGRDALARRRHRA